MKNVRYGLLVLAMFFSGGWFWSRPVERPPIEIPELLLKGSIQGENVTFDLSFTATVNQAGAELVLVDGAVAWLGDTLPGGAKLERRPGAFAVKFTRRGEQKVVFRFAAQAANEGDWRHARFSVPEATIRRLEMVCDRPDLEVRFPGALNVEKTVDAAAGARVAAVMEGSRPFEVQWMPQVRRLAGELAVSCDAHTIAIARVGTLQVDSLYTYRVVQGQLQRLALAIPPELNVTQVQGADLREWTLEPQPGGGRRLVVQLSRPKDKTYVLRVEGERVLSNFPCAFDFPVAAPQDVIRASGFVLIGADSAIKLLVQKAAGLTQIDQAAFPEGATAEFPRRAKPARSAFAYQYANLPFQMQLTADDIVTAVHADERLVLSLADNDLVLEAALDLDVRDAPSREVWIETSPGWIVASATGPQVSDYNVRDEGGVRLVHVVFREPVLGRTLVSLRLESALAEEAASFAPPRFRVRDARSERGFLALSAEQGVRLAPRDAVELREVQPSSLPMRLPEARVAYRFKSGDWSLAVGVVKEAPSMHVEIFHLLSLGDNALYGSSSITYLIGGAPARTFRLHIPKALQNVEIVGRDIRSRKQDGEVWTVTLQEKVAGDFTLLVTYDQPLAYEGAELAVGGIQTMEAESETGYIVLAGAASLAFESESKRDSTMLPLLPEELPREYGMLITTPILRAYKYVGAPHEAVVKVRRYATQPLPGQVADHNTLVTRLSEEGEAVTEMTCYVKNTSKQYLSVRLPEQAKLWSAEVDGAKVQALDQGNGAVLVPLERRRDPNLPLAVKIVYAEQSKKLGWFSRLPFRAPALEAQSIFARWRVTVPEKYRLVGSSGNLLAAGAHPVGLLPLFGAAGAWAKTLARDGWGWLLAALVLAAAACALAYARGRGRGRSFQAVAVVLAAATLLILLVRNRDVTWSIDVRSVFAEAGAVGVQTMEFSRPVTLADGGLHLKLAVMPRWLVHTRAAGVLAAGALAGLFLYGWNRRRSRRLTGLALGLVAVTWACAWVPWAMPVCAALAVLALPLALTGGAMRACYCAGVRHYAPPKEKRLFARRKPASAADSFQDLIPPERSPVPSAPVPQAEAPQSNADDAGRNAASAGELSETSDDPSRPVSGHISVVWLGMLAVLAAVGLTVASLADEVAASVSAKVELPPSTPLPPVAPTGPVFKSVDFEILAPELPKAIIRNATITLKAEIESDVPLHTILVRSPAVMTAFTASSQQAEMVPGEGGYYLKTARGGTYSVTVTFLLPIVEENGAWQIALWMPSNLRHALVLKAPGTEWEVRSPQAVFLESAVDKDLTSTRVLVGQPGPVSLQWSPRERSARLEKTVYYADVNTYTLFQPGVVSMTHLVRYQIAQGELQSLELQIPEGVSITAVTGAGLSTWRYDPEKKLLEALLEKPVSGEYALAVVAQAPRDSLPYTVELREPTVVGAARQRGAMALAATEAVQIHVEETEGVSGMNVADFPPEAVQAALQARHQEQAPESKQAYRYHQLPMRAKVSAQRVLPEVRVVEESQVDISDERILLRSQLQLQVAKAGIFSLRIEVPESFDVDTLTGDDVSHWDEVREEKTRAVLVHFTRQVLGARTLHLALSRAERRVDPQITVPRLEIREALKHTGTLSITGERGLRFTTLRRDGVSDINPRELGIAQTGVLAFRVLRPNWAVELQTEVMQPVVKADLLQRVDLSEGMLHIRGYLRYRIEHAGVKLFRLKSPAPGVALTVAGKHITRVQEIDPAQGLWEVELSGKVENEYQMEVRCQTPFDPAAREVGYVPLATEGVDAQKGYLVIMSGGRLQVKPIEVPDGLHAEDSRSLPGEFGAGDLSSAVLCYRATQPTYRLVLSVVRHESAEVLPARVHAVRMTSVVSDDDPMITRMQMDLETGSLRFLEMRLPEGSELWSVLVNGRAVSPLIEKARYLIPVERGEGSMSTIECLYGSRAQRRALTGRRAFEGPRFDLPLANLQWELFLPPSYRYHDFEGTLTYQKDQSGAVTFFSSTDYDAVNKSASARDAQKAVAFLEKGNQLMQEGRQEEARQILEEAVNYSQGQQDLNEDARIQYRNLAKQQTVVSLANRRAALKISRNVIDDQSAQQLKGYNDGNWDASYVAQVQQSLGAKESDNLSQVADKLLDQQAAAGAEVHPIRLTLPVQGVKLVFTRALQIQSDTDMQLAFKAGAGLLWRGLYTAAGLFGLFLVYAASARLLRGRAVCG